MTGDSTGSGLAGIDAFMASAEFPVAGLEVVERLGEGGGGRVWLARDPRLGRRVAVKVLDRTDRFEAEARSAAALTHPNIVTLFGADRDARTAWLVMEFVEGGSLADRLRRGNRPGPAESARLMAGIARGVAYAHRHGIVHRDLKPSNVLLTADGVPKVGDFGLAKRLDADGPTPPGSPLGTVAYMSPEAARDGAAVTPAADVYSLGVILFELLARSPARRWKWRSPIASFPRPYCRRFPPS